MHRELAVHFYYEYAILLHESIIQNYPIQIKVVQNAQLMQFINPKMAVKSTYISLQKMLPEVMKLPG